MAAIKLKWWLIVGLCLAALAVGAIQVAYPQAYLAADSFTYFTLARQVHDAGRWFSYSGLDHTTGVHPGFYFLLVPFYPLTGQSLPAFSLILGMALLVAAAGIMARRFGWEVAAVVAIILLTPYGLTLVNNGMESSLLVFSLALWFASRPADQPFRSGLALGLSLLARLDTIFLAAAFYAVWWWRRPFTFRLLARFSIGVGLVLLLIIWLNWHFGDGWLPISGELKSSFPRRSDEWLFNFWRLKIFWAAIIAMAGYWCYRRFRGMEPPTAIPILLPAVGGLYLYNALFVAGIGAWYGVLPLFALTLTAGFLLAEARASWQQKIPGYLQLGSSLLILALVVGGNWFFAVKRIDWLAPHQTAAAWLGQRSHPNEAAGELKDGVFAFYAPLPVYSLTGLANNRDYVRAVQTGEIRDYLIQRRINYIVGFQSGVQVPGGTGLFEDCRQPIYRDEFVVIYPTTACLSLSDSL